MRTPKTTSKRDKSQRQRNCVSTACTKSKLWTTAHDPKKYFGREIYSQLDFSDKVEKYQRLETVKYIFNKITCEN